ncbi:hypothetical protein [Mycolicibacterium goodii]|uniref:Uncharacterized protein n=1 Tax=Mycolicibacterium goodii TaxID=134601 RepID=A0ABS6HZK8_MYCGD|nr:hypothetical protein [Mycolicibacterium goodii]MBU8827741.1 hypothetical protein [Mycolicibacterium goodii]MBU8840765.1 hypothetical protein [Mycolicibacterium goodii]
MTTNREPMNDETQTQNAHVYLMSDGDGKARAEYRFGPSPTPKAVASVLDHYNLPTSEDVIEGFLAKPAPPNTDLGYLQGRPYYLARRRYREFE